MPPIRRSTIPVLCAATAGLLCLFQGGCVSTEKFRSLEQRTHIHEVEVDRFRKDRDALAEELRKEQGALRADLAELRADLIDLRSEIQQVRGEVSLRGYREEETARTSEAVEASLVLQMSHLQREILSAHGRLARVEDFFGLKRPEADARVPKPAAPAVPPTRLESRPGMVAPDEPAVHEAPDRPLRPEEAYEAAYRLFKAGQYRHAREGFRRFIERHPKSPLVDNALFWIGETHYRTEDYTAAILLYQEVLEKYPKGSKGPDSMLKMGYALEKIGEPQAAVVVLERLLREHPESRQAPWARSRIRQLTSAEIDGEKDRGNEAEQNAEDAAPEDKPPQ